MDQERAPGDRVPTARLAQDGAGDEVPPPLSDPLLVEIMTMAAQLPREALSVCRDLLGVLVTCDHEELAEVRQMLTAVRQLPGTPPGAKAVMRGGADLVRALDRALVESDRRS
ncbi:hypothetical protein KLP28_08890 [Nocardioidaceae bacterium]|nr:hypothetical protein KLP28_08890 [Nocardioidaceae bacterium]